MPCVPLPARPPLRDMPLDDVADLQDLPTDPSVVRRDRLLGALFAVDPGMSLLQHRPEFSLLISPNAPPQIFLLPTRDRDALTLLPRLLVETVRLAGKTGFPTHIVAIGGGPLVVQTLATAAKSGSNVRFGFHHLDDASRLAHVAGDKLPVLEAAADRIKQTEAPSPEVLREAIVRGLSLVEREDKAVTRLQEQTPVTYVLIAACTAVALFVFAKAGSSKDKYATVIELMGGLKGPLVRRGEVQRLFAVLFLHWSVTHVFINMFSLWSLGRLLEPILGSRRFFILFGLSGLGCSLVLTYFGTDPNALHAGASGGLFGLMMAIFAIIVFPRDLLPPLFLARLKSGAWRSLVLNIFLAFAPGIDVLGHFAGGFFGFVLMILFFGDGLVPMDKRVAGESIETEPRPWLTGIAVILALAMAGSIGVGILAVRG